MFLVNEAQLTCPFCQVKSKLIMPESGYLKSHDCEFCSKTIHVSEDKCCVICEYSDMYCLQKQQMGSCSW